MDQGQEYSAPKIPRAWTRQSLDGFPRRPPLDFLIVRHRFAVLAVTLRQCVAATVCRGRCAMQSDGVGVRPMVDCRSEKPRAPHYKALPLIRRSNVVWTIYDTLERSPSCDHSA